MKELGDIVEKCRRAKNVMDLLSSIRIVRRMKCDHPGCCATFLCRSNERREFSLMGMPRCRVLVISHKQIEKRMERDRNRLGNASAGVDNKYNLNPSLLQGNIREDEERLKYLNNEAKELEISDFLVE